MCRGFLHQKIIRECSLEILNISRSENYICTKLGAFAWTYNMRFYTYRKTTKLIEPKVYNRGVGGLDDFNKGENGESYCPPSEWLSNRATGGSAGGFNRETEPPVFFVTQFLIQQLLIKPFKTILRVESWIKSLFNKNGNTCLLVYSWADVLW